MSTTTHNFQIGQRVVVTNGKEFAGATGMYMGDHEDGRLLVRLDLNGWMCACHADWLVPEARAVTVTLTEPEAKLARMVLAALMRSESGTSHEIMRLVVEKIDRALPHPEA